MGQRKKKDPEEYSRQRAVAHCLKNNDVFKAFSFAGKLSYKRNLTLCGETKISFDIFNISDVDLGQLIANL